MEQVQAPHGFCSRQTESQPQELRAQSEEESLAQSAELPPLLELLISQRVPPSTS
jgi:hypothetical protein